MTPLLIFHCRFPFLVLVLFVQEAWQYLVVRVEIVSWCTGGSFWWFWCDKINLDLELIFMAGVFYNFLYCTTVPCEEIICLQNRAFVVMVLMKRRFGNFKLFDIDQLIEFCQRRRARFFLCFVTSSKAEHRRNISGCDWWFTIVTCPLPCTICGNPSDEVCKL